MRSRHIVGGVAALALTVGGSVAMTGVPAQAGSTTTPSFSSDVKPVIETNSSGDTNAVSLVDAPAPRPAGIAADASASKVATAHLKTFAGKFGVNADSLEVAKSSKLAGGHVVRFDQVVDGVKVYGGQVVSSLDHRGAQEFLVGKTAKDTDVSFPATSQRPDNSVLTAAKKAVKEAEKLASIDGMSVKPEGKLWYSAKVAGQGSSDKLIPTRKLMVRVKDHPDLAYQVLVDAESGKVVNAHNTIAAALDRMVCDTEEKPVTDDQDPNQVDCGTAFEVTRAEGDEPTGEPDVDNMYDWQKEFSERVASYVNLDVTEHIGSAPGNEAGVKKSLRASVRLCNLTECPYNNAFWNGYQATFSANFMGDDVVGHEYAHGITQYTSNLAYEGQSGAINESFSDIWGELMDQYNGDDDDTPENAWLIGEGMNFGTIRSMSDPTAKTGENSFPQPDKVSSEYYDESDPHINSGVFNKAAYLLGQPNNAVTEFNGQSVRSIGPAKLAKVSFSAQNMLTETAGFADLGTTLPLACQKYIDAPDSYVTADDCKQVELAVAATEMADAPATAKK